MAPEQTITDERQEQADLEASLRNGSLLMALAGVAFIGYGVVFLVLNFVGSGFELGVSTLDGMTKADLNPTVAYYISHLHVATAVFIISTGIAVTALSWYGVRQRLRWAWATAVERTGAPLTVVLHDQDMPTWTSRKTDANGNERSGQKRRQVPRIRRK
ncbi:hypothetical protein [Halomarina rubra]|uniref:Uncharacterized protein n=1 Tax=Halomarina rubra TaxID=2071873 RepID=A0ABD6AXL6_9EURY|nr:hypothetical protein [Halomarina rubra]